MEEAIQLVTYKAIVMLQVKLLMLEQDSFQHLLRGPRYCVELFQDDDLKRLTLH